MGFETKLGEMLSRQQGKRAKAGAFSAIEVDELDAMRRLAMKTFGRGNTRQRNGTWGGVLEADPQFPGLVAIGYYLDPPGREPQFRRRRLLFAGYKVSELEEQVALWKSMGCPVDPFGVGIPS